MTFKNQSHETSSTAVWVVVADRGRATIYSVGHDVSNTQLSVVQKLTCPDATAHPHELVSDQQGYFKGQSGSLDAGDPQTRFRQRAAAQFAREVCTHLARALQSKQFERLIVIAAPGFLGALRGVMSKQLKQSIIAQVARDLTSHPMHKLVEQISSVVDGMTVDPKRNGTIASQVNDDVLILSLLTNVGALAYENARSEFEIIVNQFASDYSLRHVVVECETSDYIGSSAIGFLSRMWKHVRTRGGSMVLCNVSPHELEVLHIMKLDRIWPIRSSQAQAVDAARAEVCSTPMA